METEKPDGFGKVIVSVHDRVPQGSFSLCIKEGERLVSLVIGSFDSLGETFCANGEARMFVMNGQDIYYIFNPRDLQSESFRKEYLPPGLVIRED